MALYCKEGSTGQSQENGRGHIGIVLRLLNLEGKHRRRGMHEKMGECVEKGVCTSWRKRGRLGSIGKGKHGEGGG